MRKEQAAPEAADGGDGDAAGQPRLGGDLGVPEAGDDGIDQGGASRGCAESVAGELEAATNLGQLPFILATDSGATAALVVYRCAPLQRNLSALVVSNPDGFVDLRDEDFAVADAAGAGRSDDGLNGLLGEVVGDDQLELHFR